MNLGLRKEEAEFVYDAITVSIKRLGINFVKELYGNIDLASILTQLQYIMELGESINEEVSLNAK